MCEESRDNYDIYARFDELYASRITLNIKRSTYLQDHIQGGQKNWHTLFCTR